MIQHTAENFSAVFVLCKEDVSNLNLDRNSTKRPETSMAFRLSFALRCDCLRNPHGHIFA